jgi:hypothetical protein
MPMLNRNGSARDHSLSISAAMSTNPSDSPAILSGHEDRAERSLRLEPAIFILDPLQLIDPLQFSQSIRLRSTIVIVSSVKCCVNRHE